MTSVAIETPSPSSRRGWFIICCALVFQAFTLGLYTYCFTFWILPWSLEFDANRAEIMMALMMGNIFLSLMAPFAGRALDRFPVQYVVATGIGIFALGMGVISQATAVWQIIAVYALLISLAISCSGPIAGQWLAVRWILEKRGTALGLVSIGSSIGGFLCPPLVTWLLEDYGWRAAHQIIAIGAALLFIPFTLFFVRAPDAQVEVAANCDNPDLQPPPVAPLKAMAVFKSSQFWLIVITLVPLILSIVVFTANLAPFSADLGIAPQQASLLMSAFAMGMIGGKLGAGILTDIMDFRHVYYVLIALLMAGMAGLALTPGYPLLVVSSLLIGISAGSFITLAASIVSNLYSPASFGTVLGLLHLSNGWSAAAIPLSGMLRESLGSYTPIWLGLIAIAIMCALFMPRLKPTGR